MQLTEQQRAELERREWRPEVECGEFQTWAKISGGCIATLYADGFFTFSGDPSLAAEFLAVADYQPPGYRFVPLELIDSVRSVVEAYREECESGSDTGVVHKLEHLYDVFSRLQQNGGEGR